MNTIHNNGSGEVINPSDPFVYDGAELSPHELFESYSKSEYGQFHALQTPRYGQEKLYFYADRDLFIAELGDDVHPTRHMLFTHDEIVVPLLNEQRQHSRVPQFSSKQENEMRTAAITHDLGECTHPKIAETLDITLVGDMPYGTYSTDDKKIEEDIREHVLATILPSIPASLRERIHAIDRNDSPDDLVSEGFNACERLGYFIRARAASKIIVTEHHLFHSYEGDPESIWRIAQLGRLAVKVENSHYSFLREKQARFPYIERAMDELLAPIIIPASKNP